MFRILSFSVCYLIDCLLFTDKHKKYDFAMWLKLVGLHHDKFRAARCGIFCSTRKKVSL